MFWLKRSRGADFCRESLHSRDRLQTAVEDRLLKVAKKVVVGNGRRGRGWQQFAGITLLFLWRPTLALLWTLRLKQSSLDVLGSANAGVKVKLDTAANNQGSPTSPCSTSKRVAPSAMNFGRRQISYEKTIKNHYGSNRTLFILMLLFILLLIFDKVSFMNAESVILTSLGLLIIFSFRWNSYGKGGCFRSSDCKIECLNSGITAVNKGSGVNYLKLHYEGAE